MCMIQSDDQEFGAQIRNFFQQELPTTTINAPDRLEVLTSIFLGTLQSRLGPVPSPENQVLIRNVLRTAIEKDARIPVLVPFGPKKPGDLTLDIAEFFVMQHLAKLQRDVQKIHPPGIHVHFRFEDLTGLWMEGSWARSQIDQYCGDMDLLTAVFEMEDFITTIRESNLMDCEVFYDTAGELVPYFHDHIACVQASGTATHTTAKLTEVGWAGGIPRESIQHYLRKYGKIYPDKTEVDLYPTLAKYYAGALARKKLKGTGGFDGPAVKVYFGYPTPWAPPEAIIHRRQIPLSLSKTHIPPWRAKGYLKINGTVRPAQADWNAPLDLTEHRLHLSSRDLHLDVQADYIREE